MLRFDADGSNRTSIVNATDVGSTTSMDFGHDMLYSTDLYMTNDRIVRVVTDTPDTPMT